MIASKQLSDFPDPGTKYILRDDIDYPSLFYENNAKLFSKYAGQAGTLISINKEITRADKLRGNPHVQHLTGYTMEMQFGDDRLILPSFCLTLESEKKLMQQQVRYRTLDHVRNNLRVLGGFMLDIPPLNRDTVDAPLIQNFSKFFIRDLYRSKNDGTKFDIDIIASPQASGIQIGAAMTHGVPVLYQTISKSSVNTVPGYVFSEEKVQSATRGNEKNYFALRENVLEGKCVLICDDALMSGGTLNASIDVVEKAGGNVKGICVLIAKSWENARKNYSRVRETRINTLLTLEKPQPYGNGKLARIHLTELAGLPCDRYVLGVSCALDEKLVVI